MENPGLVTCIFIKTYLSAAHNNHHDVGVALAATLLREDRLHNKFQNHVLTTCRSGQMVLP